MENQSPRAARNRQRTIGDRWRDEHRLIEPEELPDSPTE